jgi:hypothetical protein
MGPQVVGSGISGQANLTEFDWPYCHSQLEICLIKFAGATPLGAGRLNKSQKEKQVVANAPIYMY